MNILAINTSFVESYVAVKSSTKNVFKHMDSSLKQSENILGLVDSCLTDANIEVRELNAVSCVIGPGSFTGIRIGASLCKGICSPYESIKMVAINSLDLIAYTYSKVANSEFWVVLNALSGNLFVCKYTSSGERLIEPEMFGEDTQNQLTGTIVGLKEEYLGICNNFIELNSEDLLEFTNKLVEKEIFSKDFVPVYLRKSQAEAELDKKNGNK